MRGRYPFQVVDCVLVIDVDLKKQRVVGYVDLALLPVLVTPCETFSQLSLNFEQCTTLRLLEVRVENQAASFHVRPPRYIRHGANLHNVRDLHNYDVLYDEELDRQDEGTFVVDVPASVQHTIQQQFSQGQRTTSSSSTPQHTTNNSHTASTPTKNISPNKHHNGEHTDLAKAAEPILVRVAFEAFVKGQEQPPGLHFVYARHPTLASRPLQLQSYNSRWLPSVHSLSDDYTIRAEVSVAPGNMVLASGELLESGETMDAGVPRRTFVFDTVQPVLSRHFGLVVGPFVRAAPPVTCPVTVFTPSVSATTTSTSAVDDNNATTDDNVSKSSASVDLAFYCLPGQEALARHSCLDLKTAVDTMQEYLNQVYPWPVYRVVFMDETYRPSQVFAGLAVHNTCLLHDETIIEQTMPTREALSAAFAWSWVQHRVRVRDLKHFWIPVGVSGFLHSLYVAKAFGQSECEYRLMCFRVNSHRHLRPPYAYGRLPLSWSYCGVEEMFPDGDVLCKDTFVARKSLSVMYMIEHELGAADFLKMIKQLMVPVDAVPSLRDSNMARDDMVSSHELRFRIHKLSGKNLNEIFTHWVHGNAYPMLRVSHSYDRRSNSIHVDVVPVKWVPRFHSSVVHGDMAKPLVRELIRFRVHELDQPYSHNVRITASTQTLEFNCHNQPPRKNRRTAAQQHDDAEREANIKNDTPVVWMRVDPELSFIAEIQLKQEVYHWIAQLRDDKDAKAQLEAVFGLEQHPHSHATSTLAKVLKDPQVFYRVRQNAARVLSYMRSMKVRLQSLHALYSFLRSRLWSVGGSSGRGRSLPQLRANDFGDVSYYLVNKAVMECVSEVREPNNTTQPDIADFLVELLNENHNGNNQFTDCYWVASILRCVGNVVLDLEKTEVSGMNLVDGIMEQLKRYLQYDIVTPSYQNVLTRACLESISRLIYNKQINEPFDFVEYTEHGNFEAVRIVAFRALARHSAEVPSAWRTLMDVLQGEEVISVRASMLRAWVEVLEDFSYQSAYQGAVQNKIREEQYRRAMSRGVKVDDQKIVGSIEVPVLPLDRVLDEPFGCFRQEDCEEAVELMEYLWDVLTHTNDPFIRMHTRALYKLLWGSQAPACATPQQKEFQSTVRVVRYGAARRRIKATEELNKLIEDSKTGHSLPSTVEAHQSKLHQEQRSKNFAQLQQSSGVKSRGMWPYNRL